ncbi:zinc finger and SCAN domain-containing protein 26-like [Gouania willdenowi]|uniref:zinc finger and SCAN domain-containing protein 26-like n=1 Tax=Gouania willdenowi TaxID=441366 RepID=UPI00105462E4|nr:zinc finger and SCAN domain-containing protein 26-like [Gouania willdenowi]
MDEERAHCYPDLRAALVTKFDISPETYHQQFRSTTIPPGENPTETYHHLKGLYRRWVRPEQHSKEEIGETIILEQLLRMLPVEVRTWVKEREPVEDLTAARLALQYQNARKGISTPRNTGTPQWASFQQPQMGPCWGKSSHEPSGDVKSVPNQRGLGKDLVCFYCQQPGYKASVCLIRKAKVTGACYAPRLEVSSNGDMAVKTKLKTVLVNGQLVTALLDTGSFMSLVKQSLVPVGSMDYSRTVDIPCVHGDKHFYPKSDLTITIDEQPYLMTVGVVEHLPVDVILGCDLPVLLDLLHDNERKT